MTLEQHIHKYLAWKRWKHRQGECASIECPWCDYERETKTGRFSPAVYRSESLLANPRSEVGP